MVNAFVKTFLGWVMMEGMVFGWTANDLRSHAGAFGAVGLAFLLRVAMDSKKETPTFRNIVIQLVTTGALCFLAVYFWNDFIDWKKGFEIYLFFVSLFAVFIAGELETVFRFGFRKWLRSVFVKVMATGEEEIK